MLFIPAWRNVIAVAAIDCAIETNMHVCRDFEIMGYPTLKLLPPKAKIESVGTYQDIGKKDKDNIKTEMMNFVSKIQANHTFAETVDRWPILTPYE